MKTALYVAATYLLVVGVGEYTLTAGGQTGILASLATLPSIGSMVQGDLKTASYIDVGAGLVALGAAWWLL
jgi:hypothetical protein